MNEIKEYAEKYHIPILQKEGLNFLINYIQTHNIKTILEIGTAIGYSAINMALCKDDIKVMSIEKDPEMGTLARQNIHDFKLDNRITVILADALTIDLKEKFDLIFIDGAKGQYINFFNKFKDNLIDHGSIITDNLNFHGLVNDKNIKSRNLRGIINKINNYIRFLKENQEFKTDFFNIGDGLSVSTKE